MSIVGQEAYGANLQSSVRDAHAFVIVIDDFTTLDSLNRLVAKLAQINDDSDRTIAAPICFACLDRSRVDFAVAAAASSGATFFTVCGGAAASADTARARAVVVAAPFIACVRKLRFALLNQPRDHRGVMARFKSLFRSKRAAPADADSSPKHVDDTHNQLISSFRSTASSSLDDDSGSDVGELAAELLAAKSSADHKLFLGDVMCLVESTTTAPSPMREPTFLQSPENLQRQPANSPAQPLRTFRRSATAPAAAPKKVKLRRKGAMYKHTTAAAQQYLQFTLATTTTQFPAVNGQRTVRSYAVDFLHQARPSASLSNYSIVDGNSRTVNADILVQQLPLVALNRQLKLLEEDDDLVF